MEPKQVLVITFIVLVKLDVLTADLWPDHETLNFNEMWRSLSQIEAIIPDLARNLERECWPTAGPPTPGPSTCDCLPGPPGITGFAGFPGIIGNPGPRGPSGNQDITEDDVRRLFQYMLRKSCPDSCF